MRVLMVTNDYPPKLFGGIGRHVFSLTTALRHIGVDVTVLTPKRDEDETSELGVIRVPPIGPNFPPSYSGFLSNIAMAAKGGELVNKTNFDVIHAHDVFAILAAASLADLSKTPLIMTRFSRNPMLKPVGVPLMDPNHVIALINWSISQAMRLIAVGNSIYEDLCLINKEAITKCVTIYNGTDVLTYPNKEALEVVRRRLSTEYEKILLLVGRIHQHKGGDLAIRALSMLPEFSLKLVFVGEGDYKSELEQLAIESGVSDRVTFMGFIEFPNLVDIYRAADIILVPSRFDTYPTVVLDNLALGKIVIASRTGGIAEQIQDGYTGLLHEPESVEDLVRCIKWALENPNSVQHLANQAKEYTSHYLTWDAIAQQTLQVYEATINSV